MLHIVIAIIVAVVIGYYFYSGIEDKDSAGWTNIAIKAGLPGISSGVIAYYLSKSFISGEAFHSEPTMQGSFFDP